MTQTRRFNVPMSAIEEDVNGICLSCGEVQYGGVEPDARGYTCESCGAKNVSGLAEACLMGQIEVGGEDEDDGDTE